MFNSRDRVNNSFLELRLYDWSLGFGHGLRLLTMLIISTFNKRKKNLGLICGGDYITG